MKKEQYEKLVTLLKQVAPEQRWMPILISGYSAANVIFLRKALEEEKINPEFQPKVKPPDPADERKISKLSAKLTKLFAERAKLSNRFHVLTTVTARAKNSDKIQEVQDQMAVLYKQMDFFRATGQLITEYEDEHQLPNDKYALAKKLNTIRASISRERRNVKIIQTMLDTELTSDDAEKQKEMLTKKLNHKQKRLKTLLIQKTYAETKLESL